jgi:flagellar biosynthesis protein FliR
MIVLDDATLYSTGVAFFLISIRLAAMILAAPLFSAAAITLPIRIALVMSLAAVLTPTLNVPPVSLISLTGFLLIAQEILLGLAIGFIMQIAFAAVAMAGEQISFSTGLGFAAMIDPQTGAQSPVITQFLSILLTFIFLSVQAHHVLIRELATSYHLLPIGASLVNASTYLSIIQTAALMFSDSLLIALPVIIALFLINLVIGVLTRVAPQLNIFSVGFPITILVGLGLMLITLPSLGAGISSTLDDISMRMRQLILMSSGG